MNKNFFIEIRGVQFVNKGAYLMLLACMDQIGRLWPDAKIILPSNQNSPYEARIALGTWQKLSLRFRGLDFNRLAYLVPRRLRLMLQRQFGLVMEPEIALVLDASGFAYGDQWGGRAVRVLAAEIRRLAAHQKGYVLLPQALGPFGKAADRQALARGLPDVLLVCPRDPVSLRHIAEVYQGAQVQQFTDFTNLLPPAMPSTEELPVLPYALVIPNSAMLSGRNKNTLWQPHYLVFLQKALDACRQHGLIPVLLNHEGKLDMTICLQLQQRNPDVMLISPEHPQLVKGWIAAAALVISSRFHGCVSALSCGVPCIATSWSHKYEMLFAEYQQSAAVVGPETDTTQLVELMTQLRQPENLLIINDSAKQWKRQSELLWQTVALVVTKARDSGRVNL